MSVEHVATDRTTEAPATDNAILQYGPYVVEAIAATTVLLVPFVSTSLTVEPASPVRWMILQLGMFGMVFTWLAMLNERGRFELRMGSLTILLALFIAVQGASLATTPNLGLSFSVFQQRLLLLLGMVALSNTVVSGSQGKRLCAAFVVAASVAAIVAIVRHAGSPAESASLTPALTVIVLPLAIGMTLSLLKSFWRPLCALASVLLAVAVVYCAAGWVAAVCAVAFVVVGGLFLRKSVWEKARRQKSFRLAGLTAAAVLVVSLTVLGWFSVGRYLRPSYLVSLPTTARTEAEYRVGLVSTAAATSLAKPLLGSGVGSYEIASAPYLSEAVRVHLARGEEPGKDLPNLFLVVSAESGLLGVAALFWLIVSGCVTVVRRARRSRDSRTAWLQLGLFGGIVAFVCRGLATSQFELPSASLYFFLALGLLDSRAFALGIARRPSFVPARTARSSFKSKTRYALVWIALAASLLVVPARSVRYFLADVHLKRGVVAANLNFYQEAAKEFDTAMQLGSGNWLIPFEASVASNAAGDSDATVRALEECLRLNPNQPTAYANLGSVYAETGDYRAAVRSFKRAVQLVPERSYVLYNLGVCYVHLQRWDEAVAHFEAARQRGCRRNDMYRRLGISYAKLGQLEKALDYFKQASDRQPDNPEVFFDLGVVHLDAGNVAKAKQAFNLAGKFAADSGDQRFSTLLAQVNYELAMLALEHDGDMMRASAHAWEYCRLAPANTEALELVDSIAEYLDSGRLSSEEREGAYEVHYNVASSYQLLGNLDKAASHYQTALAGLPEDETVLRYQACVQLAVLALEQGLVPRAMGWVGEAKKTGAATADGYRVEGEINLKNGDDARAAELFRKALELDPNDEASKARLKQLRSTL